MNFSWGTGSPARSIDPDTFSVRWTGQVEAPASGTYTFYTQTSDGVRLWVNGERLIGKWVNQRKREWSGTISLEAGKRYPIKMEYFEGTGEATAKLLWSGPGVSKQVIPRNRLYLPGTPPPPSIDGDLWSDPATWGGQVPAEGEAVTIPADKTVVLDTSPPPLKSLQIDGTLVFDDRDLALSADWIMVRGKLQIGAEGAPFRHDATISLTGTNRDENIMGMGPKVLGVMGGTLELHGKQRLSWTKLGATASKGSTQITLDEAPDWRPGGRIVISSTDYDPFQREEATITAVSGNVVTLDKALAYTHWGVTQTFDGRVVDERAEVALLSRNVKIEGEQASSADELPLARPPSSWRPPRPYLAPYGGPLPPESRLRHLRLPSRHAGDPAGHEGARPDRGRQRFELVLRRHGRRRMEHGDARRAEDHPGRAVRGSRRLVAHGGPRVRPRLRWIPLHQHRFRNHRRHRR